MADGSSPKLHRWKWAGLCVILISLVLMRVQPNHMAALPPGMVTPVLALELARTPAEIERAFGADVVHRESWRRSMTRGTWVDFALLGAYGVFLTGVASELAGGSRAASAGLVLAPVAACFDAVENRELLTIFANLGGDYTGALAVLRAVTWVKWIALGMYFVTVSRALWQLGGFARAAAAIGLVGSAATLFALFLRGIPAEIMLNAVSIGIAGLVVVTYRSKSTAS